MARDRRRNRGRRAEGGRRPPSEEGGAAGAAGRSERDADEAPDPLTHASAEVDLAEERLKAGAVGLGNEDGDPDPDALEGDAVDDAELEAQAVGAGGGGRGAGTRLAKAGAEPPAEGERKPGALRRFGTFLRACVAELRRVQWPDRRQTAQGTAVTLGFVVIAGGYLGLADFFFSRLVDLII